MSFADGQYLTGAALTAALAAVPSTVQDGTAAAPSFAGASDPTTGFFRNPVTNAFTYTGTGQALTTFGEEWSVSAFRLSSDGNDWALAIQRAHDRAASLSLPGITLRLPANNAMVWASAVTITTPIRLVGHGIGASRFLISNLISNNGYLIVNAGATSNEVRCRFEGFTAQFTQIDTANQSALTQYPPFLYVQATPRLIIENIRIACGWRGIAFIGNCGGAEISWLQTSCLYRNLEIDGCLDTMMLLRWHCYPFDLNANQQKIFYSSACVGLYSGRCDDLKAIACLWFCGQSSSVTLFAGATGSTFGTFVACDFDNFGALNMSAGEVNITGGSITLGDSASSAILFSGGDLSVTGVTILASTAPANGQVISQTVDLH